MSHDIGKIAAFFETEAKLQPRMPKIMNFMPIVSLASVGMGMGMLASLAWAFLPSIAWEWAALASPAWAWAC